jgi:hypothetical protein
MLHLHPLCQEDKRLNLMLRQEVLNDRFFRTREELVFRYGVDLCLNFPRPLP